jgi:dephospho-CoA kinase
MITVGLTGGIGAGKSTVSAGLAARGAVVIDADAITRELQQPGRPVFDAMVERFGAGIVAADGTLDRRAVADLVFPDPAALADLNGIVHPAVGAEITRRLAAAAELPRTGTGDGERSDVVVVLDVPLLVESRHGHPDRVGTIVVDCDPEVAVGRLVDQRGFTEADARARIARQASRVERLARADFVIDNGGSLAELEPQISACWAWIRAGAATTG